MIVFLPVADVKDGSESPFPGSHGDNLIPIPHKCRLCPPQGVDVAMKCNVHSFSRCCHLPGIFPYDRGTPVRCICATVTDNPVNLTVDFPDQGSAQRIQPCQDIRRQDGNFCRIGKTAVPRWSFSSSFSMSCRICILICPDIFCRPSISVCGFFCPGVFCGRLSLFGIIPATRQNLIKGICLLTRTLMTPFRSQATDKIIRMDRQSKKTILP